MMLKILRKLLCVAVGVLATVGLSQQVANLLTNPSFEDPIKGTWKVGGFQMKQYAQDKVHGNYAALCSQRKSANSGPIMKLPTLKKGGRYAFEGSVKVLQDKPKLIWQNVKVLMIFDGASGADTNGTHTTIKVPENTMQIPSTPKSSQKQKPKPTKKPEKTKSCKGLKGESKKKCKAQRKEEKRKKRERNLQKKEEKQRKREERERRTKEKNAKKEKGVKQMRSGTSGTVKSSSSSSAAYKDPDFGTDPDRSPVPVTYYGPKKDWDSSSSGSHGDPFTYVIAYRGFVRSEQGWIRIAGNVNAPMKDFTGARLAIRGPQEGVDFLLDNLTLWEVPEHPDWEAQARINIDKYRKSSMRFRINLPRNVPASDVEIKIDHKRHKFAFGSKVEDDLITDTTPLARAYQQLFYYLFNWATVGSWKWKFGKPIGGNAAEPVYLDFSRAEQATDALLERGLKVRAHAILWGHEKNNLDSVLRLNGTQLKEAVTKRVRYIVEKARGKVAQWDVANEFIHGHYFEETTKDANISIDAFKLTKQLDPGPKLYLNDFQCVTTGAQIEDYHDLAMRFMAAGTGIQGLGIQGHTKDYTKPDPTMIWKRLDRLAETGLELFMTEFDIPWDDVYERADWLEDSYRAFFAHPGLSGVVLWGFWQERMEYKNMYLVHGDNLQFVEPGERVACLVKKEWSTHVTKNLADSSPTFDLRGFLGDYEVIVKRAGVPVQKETFSLDTTATLAVNIDVTESTVPIQVVEEVDLVPQCVSHRGNKSVGVISSTYKSPSLVIGCENRQSAASSTDDGGVAEVTCQTGWVMTGCSSYKEGPDSARKGERIVVEGGVPKCRAFNANRGTAGSVYAVARCCHAQQGLTCDYQVAGPSLAMAGARAEARCGAGFFPLGCSAYSQSGDLDGVFPNAEAKSCVAQSGEPTSDHPGKAAGVFVTAACCRGTNVVCSTVKSGPQPLTAQVGCPAKSVITGCHAFSQNGQRTTGARVFAGNQDSACQAYNANGNNPGSTVVAHATICNAV